MGILYDENLSQAYNGPFKFVSRRLFSELLLACLCGYFGHSMVTTYAGGSRRGRGGLVMPAAASTSLDDASDGEGAADPGRRAWLDLGTVHHRSLGALFS